MFRADANVRAALRKAIVTIRLSHPFAIEAWVLLPDHMHALWTVPPAEHEFSHRWHVIKRIVKQRYGATLTHDGTAATLRMAPVTLLWPRGPGGLGYDHDLPRPRRTSRTPPRH